MASLLGLLSTFYSLDVPSRCGADGHVDFDDLPEILGDWGPCPPCPTDLDGGGIVGVSDLLVLLGDRGPCPE